MAFIKLPEGAAPSTPASGTVVAYAKADGYLYSKDDVGTETKLGGGGGTGDVVGPASATNNSLARFDGTTGKLLKDGAVIGTDVQAYDADTAKTDVSQTFTLPQYGTGSTDNDLSFDIGATGKQFFTCTPSAGGTLTFTSIPASPCWVTIKLVNTANYAIAAHANTKVTASFLATISATGTYIIAGYCDGTNVHCATAGASA